eukprot:CAMPEP_0197847020 /NCGR_PEP_ID=MMETSP1438-20131217/5005_1 /TAXON_ID=1461541 /ORGANISM="Pterosperma sp., Strain CCMP1384" /LENGTH=183 /DNA_ID=CAMNT_0043458825 /DNA_START=91 /DNA_END=642 /DNA_ORIENTATION=+
MQAIASQRPVGSYKLAASSSNTSHLSSSSALSKSSSLSAAANPSVRVTLPHRRQVSTSASWFSKIFETAGGRGLGEKNLKTEGQPTLPKTRAPATKADQEDEELPNLKAIQSKFPTPDISNNRFVSGKMADKTGKEDGLFGLLTGATGGFAGGEEGLKQFVAESKEIDDYKKREAAVKATDTK